MSETTGTPAVGTWGTVAPYGVTLSSGRGNPAPLRALYVGVHAGPWELESGERVDVYVLELESGERFEVERASVLARIFRPDAPESFPSAIGAVVRHPARTAGGSSCLDCGELAAAPVHAIGATPDARTPVGAYVRELRTGAVGRIAAGASSAALMVRLETGAEAGPNVYGMHPSELELITDEQYLSARYAAASLPAAPELRDGVRVAVHPAADLWMRGVRYGTVYGAPYRRNGLELIGITADSGQRFAARVADLSVVR